MSQALSKILLELNLLCQPLRDAAASAEAAAAFLARFGRDAQAGISALAALNGLGSALAGLSQAAATAGNGGEAEALALVSAAKSVFDSVRALPSGTSVLAGIGVGSEFFGECLDLLAHDYLQTRMPVVFGGLEAAGVVDARMIHTWDPGGRALDYLRIEMHWFRLKQLVSQPGQWAAEVYGWGVDFDYLMVLERLAAVVDGLGRTSYVDDMTDAQIATFLTGLPSEPSDLDPVAGFFPILARRLPLAAGPAVQLEAGLALVPFGDLSSGPAKDLGLALAPYAQGALDQDFQLSSLIDLHVKADADATVGAALVLTPGQSPYVKGVAGGSGDFEFAFVAKPATGPLRLIGGVAGNRLEADAFHLAAGGAIGSAPDMFVAGGLENLKLIIDPSEDGFLGKLIAEPIEATIDSVLVGWRPSRGVYFEGGSSLEVVVPIEKKIGPVDLHDITISLDWANDVSIAAAVSADARLGPLYAYVKGLGVELTIKPDEAGVLGRYDLDFSLKKPTGYAVSLDAAPIVGGGYLDVLDHQYRGALALKLKSIGFSAFAILDTQLPGGAKGFSFVASIFGEFTIPIGEGFFLTGLGGIIGINRTVDSGALRDVLYAGQLGNLLFPSDPIANAPQILSSMAAIFPPMEGQYLFGPAARIEFSKPPLITGKLAVILEIGGQTRLLILGALYAQLPSPNSPIVDLRLAFMGEIDFSAETVSIDATLQGSKILSFPVSGDVAVRTGWSGHVDQVMSFGGLHPQYPSPANLPNLRRLSISFGGNNPRITLTSYQALTLNSLQFGAHADLYAQGPSISVLVKTWDLAAEGHAYFDALIYFNPFAFDIALGADLSLLVNNKVKASLGFDLRLSGPNVFVIDGRVWVTVSKIDIEFSVHHAWGSKQSEAPAIASPAAMVWKAFSDQPVLEPVPSANLAEGVVFAPSGDGSAADKPLNPMGGARLTQRSAPLGIDVQKVGEARVVSGDTRVDVRLLVDNQPLAMAATELEFVRGHFWALSEGDRLRSPAFERHQAGVEIAADATISIDGTAAVAGDLSYETIVLGAEPSLPSVLADVAFAHASAAHAILIDDYAVSIATPLNSSAVLRPARADAVVVTPITFALAASDPVDATSQLAMTTNLQTFSHALAAGVARSGLRSANPAIASYLAQ